MANNFETVLKDLNEKIHLVSHKIPGFSKEKGKKVWLFSVEQGKMNLKSCENFGFTINIGEIRAF